MNISTLTRHSRSSSCVRAVPPMLRGYVLGLVTVLVVAQAVNGAVTNDTGNVAPAWFDPTTPWKDSGNAYVEDGAVATAANKKDLVSFGRFNLAIPAGALICGIEVRVKWAGSTTESFQLGTELSWDGGQSFTLTGNSATRTTMTLTNSTFGGSSDSWGKSNWYPTDFSTNTFQVRLEVIDRPKQGQKTVRVDSVTVKVYFTGITEAIINNNGASNVTATTAILLGQVMAGVPAPIATIYWGTNNVGTNKSEWTAISMGEQTGVFSSPITNLLANQQYFFRCHATNFLGETWADAATNFTTLPPTVTLATTPYNVTEDGTSQVVTVTLNETSAIPVTIDFATSDGTASAGSDYTGTNGTLTWAAGEAGSRTFAVAISNDANSELDETLGVTFSNAVGCIIANTNATIAILDNDSGATLRFASHASSGLEFSDSPTLLLTLSPTSETAVKVDYSVIGGTASNTLDYTLVSGVATVTAGQASTTIPLAIINDSLDEPDETIIVQLSNPAGCTIGFTSNHTYTILDNDFSPPTINNRIGAANISSAGAMLRGEVTSTGGENPSVTVYWGTNNGETAAAAWSNSVSMSSLGIGAFSTNISGLVSNRLYYYRCSASNSGGVAWAPYSENFVADDPPRFSLLSNPGFETQGATPQDAAHWGRSNTAAVTRSTTLPRTGGLRSMEYTNLINILIYGTDNNAFRISWGGLYTGGGTHPSGGIRPGFRLDGSSYTRAEQGQVDPAQFNYRLRDLDTQSNWLSVSLFHDSTTYASFSASNSTPIPAGTIGNRFRPELSRDAGTDGYYYADDLTLYGYPPKLDLELNPTNAVVFPNTASGYSASTNFGVRSQGGVAGTILYGANITNFVDLTNAAWNGNAWHIDSDPGNAFSITAGANLIATNDMGYQYATIRFAPPGEGIYTAFVHVATTDPVDRYPGGGLDLNSIVYEEYTLIGVGLSPELSIGPVTVTEGNSGTTGALFHIVMSGACVSNVTVAFTTSNGTAVAGTDYTATNGTVIIEAGQTTGSVMVLVSGDQLFEAGPETFHVNLSDATNATIATGQGVGTITDDDSIPSASVTDITIPEGNTGTTNAVFAVSLSNPGISNVTVSFTTSNGTALAGTDYVATNGTVTIPAGQTQGSITVVVNGDLLLETNETFYVLLSDPVNATIGDGEGLGTIQNAALLTGIQSSGHDVLLLVHNPGAQARAILAADNCPTNAWNLIYTVVETDTFTFTNPWVATDGARRFYRLVTEQGGQLVTNCDLLALYATATVTGNWYKLSMPIDFGASNRMDSTLGAQLARGLGGNNANGDLSYVLDAVGVWQIALLDSNGTWLVNGTETPASFEVQPWQSFWIKRRSSGTNSISVFTGPVHTAPQTVTFGAGRWHMIAWPFSTPRREDEGTVSNKGWGFAAAGGKKWTGYSGADKLYVGQGSSGTFYYLNMEGRWCRPGYSTPSSNLVFRAGESYYYFHNGSGFVWTAREE